LATSSIDRAKQAVRERVWRALEDAHAVPSGVSGHIPAFYDAPAAAERLATLTLWRASGVVKAVPDRPQQPVRERVLADGKLLYMAVPKLANVLPFYELDPARLGTTPAQAANKEGAALAGNLIAVDDMRPIDLIVTGCVAVDRSGARLGKGAGYSDIEVALLIEAGLISDQTVIVTTVHPLQVVDEPIPETDHDFHVDVIVTPHDVITTGAPKRGAGLDWESLTPEKISAIPVLARLARENGRFPA
jgi:5-formyltetrahydrofolate cyclo-ligase